MIRGRAVSTLTVLYFFIPSCFCMCWLLLLLSSFVDQQSLFIKLTFVVNHLVCFVSVLLSGAE